MVMFLSKFFRNDDTLKAAGVPFKFTPEQEEEIVKCMDLTYFAENYVKISVLGKGVSKFDPYPYQSNIIDVVDRNRFVICCMPRQCGKSTIFAIIIVHSLIFNSDYNILIAANKHKSALEIMNRIKTIYRNLPKWLQQGVVKFNESNIELENGSKVRAEATSKDAGRSGSFDFVLLDEFAFVEEGVAREFYESIYPTISSSDTTKMCIISTPNGMNHFYEMWNKATKGESEYDPVQINWFDVPGRDEDYKRKTIANTSEETWNQEYACEFTGGSDTLISGKFLSNVTTSDPIETIQDIKIFERPIRGNSYFMTVDTSRGKGLDYSAFAIFDITETPYRVVATYMDNDVDNLLFPSIINYAGKLYNDAYVLIEINNGTQISHILYEELEYENMLWTSKKGRKGQVLEFYGNDMGVTTSVATKSLGTKNLKTFIENHILQFEDFEIKKQLSNFVVDGKSYSAKKGQYDDMVMCLVIFAWATTQECFREMSDIDLRRQLYDKREREIEEDLLPVGFLGDPAEDEPFIW